MAINFSDKQLENKSIRHSIKHSNGSLPSSHLSKLCINTNGSITSNENINYKMNQTRKTNNSPYLTNDSVQFFTRVTEKRLYTQNKKGTALNSFPLAGNIYRANSDEIKPQKKGNKKIKKSVLTLPNRKTEMPQMCTVSDTNDSKLFDLNNDKDNVRVKKPFLHQNRKTRARNKTYEFYDRDARYCSQMNIKLDCSSTDMSEYNGGSKRAIANNRREPGRDREFNANNVWTVLRNINRFQFKPSPPMSEDSIKTIKRKKVRNKRKNKRKDTRLIETCFTKEFAYVSKHDVISGDDKSSGNLSANSSIDRITIIDKSNEICGKKNENPPKTIMTGVNKLNNKNNIITKTIKQKDGGDQHKNKKHCKLSIPIDINTFDNLDKIELKNDSQDAKPQNTKILTDCKVAVRNKETSKTLYTGCRKLTTANTSPRFQLGKETTNIVLNEGQNNESQDKTTLLRTSLSNSKPFVQNMTQTDIKRKLANLRFPIVILGKDQLSSTYMQVMNYEPAHLQILDQQIWPFMQDWYDENKIQKEKATGNVRKAEKNGNKFFVSSNKTIECKNVSNRKEIIASKQTIERGSKINNNFVFDKKTTLKRPVEPNELKSHHAKSTPIHQINDKMLNLIYKNTGKGIEEQFITGDPIYSSSNCVQSVEIKPKTTNKVDVATETFNHECSYKNLMKNTNTNTKIAVKRSVTNKRSWAKSKWPSEFIETVLNKIRNGIYYSVENKYQHKITNLKEVQTIITGKHFKTYEESDREKNIKTMYFENQVTQNNRDEEFKPLPGFNETLPVLEIKTLNMKEVAVKHCTTNVVVQFDIGISSERDSYLHSMQKTTSFEALKLTESHTKIYKSKITIVNAVLPAEICSLFPKIIRSILDLNKLTSPALPSSAVPLLKDSLLYTITELNHSENEINDIFKSTLPPVIIVSPLIKLLNGMLFSKAVSKQAITNNKLPALNYSNCEKETTLLSKLSPQRLFSFKMNPVFINLYVPIKKNPTNEGNYFHQKKPSTSLQLYDKSNFILNSIFGRNRRMFEKCHQVSIQTDVKINTMPLSLVFCGNQITINMKNKQGFEEKFTIIIDNLYFNTILQQFIKRVNKNKATNNDFNAIEYQEHMFKLDKKAVDEIHPVRNISDHLKTRKQKFAKVYKKSKSISNISREHRVTALSNIMNIEDFLEAAGIGKTLSSIFDGLSQKKTMSSILEMKNWISEISQRQAMLLILLTNKKDTPNLVRFRPILLQGIAVHRITRASELDMEIEVIERENFNKFSKFEGIPYGECVENHDALMEELYWIAKTTASDYQQPFNEASEKLLKSLLEKRKKLNPSYLRVMARYVGLGLLKSPRN